MLAFRLENFIDTRNLDKLADLYELINENRLTVKDTGINYRVINHWDNMGLIRFGRNKKEGNRKFSFIDFIWIKVVNELRSFGVQLPVIKKITGEIYESIPLTEMMDNLAKNLHVLHEYSGENKSDFIQFLKSGEYKTLSDIEGMPAFNFLQILIIEAIGAGNLVSLIVFQDGEWFPYIKSQERHYPRELIVKKEIKSQVRISLTEIVFRYIVEDAFKEYSEAFGTFSYKEAKLLSYIKEGDYKQVYVLFKSRQREPMTIKKNKAALEQITGIIREGQYREFILTDKKNTEFRITEKDPLKEAAELREREEAFATLNKKGDKKSTTKKSKKSSSEK